MPKTFNPSFCALIEESIVNNWNRDALTDWQGITYQYQDVARKIEKVHILFEHSGIQKGDKIAICGRNSSNWVVAFMATLTYGAVAVPVLHEFHPDQIHNIVNHSEAKLLFVGDWVATQISPDEMPSLEGIINIPDYSLLVCRSEKLDYAREHLNELFGKKFPKFFRKEMVHYYREESPEELALINYTSGTTGFSKGVMVPYRALWSNYVFAEGVLGDIVKVGDNVISILPMAHMYGMAFEFLFEFIHGCHVYYLTRTPSPAIIAQALATVKPTIMIAVPLVIEKIIKKKVLPKLQTPTMQILLNVPIVNNIIKQKVCEQVKEAFGGKLYEVIIGGAALNQDVEKFLKGINFPYTVGYGATECAPIISYSDWHTFAPGSCGREVLNMTVKIDSSDPQHIPGEILAKGMNVMLGYYKNPEATEQTIDKDGWYHTGDLGLMDADGNIFIKGRSKNMLLGPNGQNIYPEEVEDKLNSMEYVVESLVIQREGRLIGLVYPDYDDAKAHKMTQEQLAEKMEQNRNQLNETQPPYQRLAAIELRTEEFEKTPKKSIKRYLYK